MPKFLNNVVFTDAVSDIGATGATRPRDLFLSRNALVGGVLAVGTTTTTNAINLPAATTTIQMESAAAGVPGAELYLQASNSGAGTNLGGGGCNISAGSTTGNVNSRIFFNVAVGGTSGTTVNNPVTRMILSGSGILTIHKATLGSLSVGIDGTAARTLGLERNATAAGNTLTVNSGDGLSGGTDLAGGNLVLRSGISTGTGTSIINLQVPTPAASTGTGDNAPGTVLSVGAEGITATGHYLSAGSAPTIAAGAAADATATVTISGNDQAGLISITAAGTPTTLATLATITFNKAYASAPKAVILTPANQTAALQVVAARPWVDFSSNPTTTSFAIKSGTTALTASSVYKFWYWVIG